ncbi:Uncharacterised protein [Salmonella enterica subsp. enterica]|uniref:Uncharacterized protein n=1 Tax=Salmonella enterica I TaxID=59201 RepID=A0A379WSP3_SALET|nr:Uncharacterised protein [Salmonella enterica subsp. enterica]
MIMLILAPLVGVLGALLLAYGAWLIYPRRVLLLPGRCACSGRGWWRDISTVHSSLSAEVNSVLFGIISTKK